MNGEKTEQIDRQIHFVYFVNPARVDLLKLSLKSLNLLNHPSIKETKVFVYLNNVRNEKEILKIEEEINALKLKLNVKLVMRKYFNKYYGGRGGLKEFNPQMRVYLEMNEKVWDNHNAIVCKVDTDVLFISNKVFDEVIESDADLIGHPCICRSFVDQKKINFIQGGIYFLKSSIIPKIMNIDFHRIIKKVCPIIGTTPDKCGEDTLITYCVKEVGKVEYLKIQLAGNIVKSLNEENLKIYSKEYSVIHFHRCSTRSEMERVSKILLNINKEKVEVEE